MRVVCVVCVVGLSALTGCSGPLAAGIEDRIPPYTHVVGTPKNVIERALALCPDKTEAAETKCVKQGIADAHLSVAGLTGMVSNCGSGSVCHYEYTTEDRLGYVSATSANYRARWRVDFDLQHPTPQIENVPIKVTQIESS